MVVVQTNLRYSADNDNFAFNTSVFMKNNHKLHMKVIYRQRKKRDMISGYCHFVIHYYDMKHAHKLFGLFAEIIAKTIKKIDDRNKIIQR